MTTYIAFLLLIFVLPSIAPRLFKHPAVLILCCLGLCLTFYGTRVLG